MSTAYSWKPRDVPRALPGDQRKMVESALETLTLRNSPATGTHKPSGLVRKGAMGGGEEVACGIERVPPCECSDIIRRQCEDGGAETLTGKW